MVQTLHRSCDSPVEPVHDPAEDAAVIAESDEGVNKRVRQSHDLVEDFLRRIGKETGRGKSVSHKEHRKDDEHHESSHNNSSTDLQRNIASKIERDERAARYSRGPRTTRWGWANPSADGDRGTTEANKSISSSCRQPIEYHGKVHHAIGGERGTGSYSGNNEAGAGGRQGRSREEELFTEAMWESTSCRQVLDAMFFGASSAVPRDSIEEYRELEEFVPKLLARRAKAKSATTSASNNRRPNATIGDKPGISNTITNTTRSINAGSASTAATGSREAVTTSRHPASAPPAALSNLPSTFHKRYLMNFTVLTPEQQWAAEEADRRKVLEARQRQSSGTNRSGRPDPRGSWNESSARIAGPDRWKAALRKLSGRGVLEQEEVKAMLRPGPLEDFRGSVLQAFLDFRMRRSFAKVLKIRRDRAALPIAAFKHAIIDAVASNPCVLVAGDTGCGKSTQVPQFLLQAGYGRVACTQPRRISAVGLCRRVSYETLNEHGSEVAYQVRFDSSRRRSSRILFLTEGLLLRQIASDPDLSAYSVVIVDEVHERHAGCDFLLGLLRAVLRRRSDLKVVLMSATINPELFSRFFDGAPLIRVPGRMHPVEVRYVPTAADNDLQEVVSRHDGEGQRKLRSRGGREGKRQIFDARPYVKLLQTIDTTTPMDERGDLLVFLSGMGDILAVSEGTREYVESTSPRRWVVLMLHSSLSVEEQDKVFDAAPLGTRKMILATNIAETSVTIDGVRFVADSGKAKEMSWDPASGVRSLQEFWVSRASAEQRKGRAGRTGPGLCFRLYANDTFDRLAPFAEPEIRRCPLEGLVLQMKSLGLQDPRLFPYLSPPPPENLRAALETLALVGATDAVSAAAVASPAAASTTPAETGGAIDKVAETPASGSCAADGGDVQWAARAAAVTFENATARAPLTPLGRVLSALPVDPSVGKMLALGALFGESEHVLTLAAALTTQSPFESRAAATATGVNPVAEFASPDGDPFTVMNAYDEWIRVKAARQESSRRWCKRHGLQEQRLYEITKLRRQFEDLLASAGLLWLGAAAQRARRAHQGRRRRLAMSADAGTTGRGPSVAMPSKAKLHALKMRKEGRKRKMLEIDHGGDKGSGGAAGDGDDGDDSDEGQKAHKELLGEVGDGGRLDGIAGLDLSSLEFYMAQDVDQLAESSGRRLTRRDVALLKVILCQGLYPNFAVADAGNAGRPSTEQQYVTRPSAGLFMSPSSVLACQDFAAFGDAAGVAGGRELGGRRSGARAAGRSDGVAGSRGAAADAGRGDGLLCFGQLMETQRPFVSSVTPLPALQSLLLFSSRVDTSEDASLMLFDHWLVVEMRGLDPALTGQKLLAVACGLRARLGALLSGALEEAERRKETGRLARAGNDGGTGGMSRRGGRGPGDKEEHRLGDEGLEDLPPMLTLARRAWFEGVSCRSEKERVKRDGHGGSQGDGGGGAVNHNDVDWAQEAEELSVELAEFMLQSIGYDVRSISPRQVESMLIDPLRMREPAAVRSILQGHVGSDIPGTFSAGKPDAEKSGAKSGREDGTRMDMTTSPSSLDGGRGEYDGDKADRARHGRRNLSRVGDEMETESERGQGSNKNIRSSNSDDGNDRTILVRLLAALSKAAEEEVRGSKGLFGLESGVLERLKGGVRVTPFLRHGSLRREASTGRAPHGLLADGGMKKWWRCPKCHVSQVVGLEDIHEHFKVCLVDPAPPHSSSSCSPANTDTSKTPNDPNPTATDTTSNAPKRTRLLVGTPFKSSGWTRRGGGVGSAGPRDGTKRAREDGSGGT